MIVNDIALQHKSGSQECTKKTEVQPEHCAPLEKSNFFHSKWSAGYPLHYTLISIGLFSKRIPRGASLSSPLNLQLPYGHNFILLVKEKLRSSMCKNCYALPS